MIYIPIELILIIISYLDPVSLAKSKLICLDIYGYICRQYLVKKKLLMFSKLSEKEQILSSGYYVNLFRNRLDRIVYGYIDNTAKDNVDNTAKGCIIKHGIHREWKYSGKLWREATYKNGKLHGVWREWYSNDKLQRELTYKHGKKHGIWREWAIDGKLWRETTCKNGKEHGIYRRWWDNGKLKIEATYENGKEHGIFRRWYYNGELKIEKTYKNGIKM